MVSDCCGDEPCVDLRDLYFPVVTHSAGHTVQCLYGLQVPCLRGSIAAGGGETLWVTVKGTQRIKAKAIAEQKPGLTVKQHGDDEIGIEVESFEYIQPLLAVVKPLTKEREVT